MIRTLSSKSSGEDMYRLPTSFLFNIQSCLKQEVDKCAKYQEGGLCGSREKCDRNYLVSKFAHVHNIQSRVKQEVDMPQIQKCVTRYSSPY